MKKSDIIQNLESFGLSSSEAKVYIATLSLEDAVVDDIAKVAETNRTSTYPILERLESLGLISHYTKRGKTYHKAANPEKLFAMAEEKKQKIEKILPQLKGLFAVHEGRPNVEMYEGTEGLKTVLENILHETKTEVLIFSDGESFLNKIPGWSDAYIMKRARKNIRTKLIVKGTGKNIDIARSVKKGLAAFSKTTDIKVIPEAYKIDYSGFDIYNNKVVFYSFDKQNIAVVIESKLINALMRTVYDILWSEASRYDHLLK